jgi:hydrogenase maturation protease
MTAPLVVGIGNGARGDDRAGIAVARLLRRCRPQDRAVVAESDGDVGAILDAFQGRERVILVDACHSGMAPGTVRRFQAHRHPLPASLEATSTHGLGLAAAIDLARTLGRLPADVTVYAIEGRTFAFGDRLSPEVRDAVFGVAGRIARELGIERPAERVPDQGSLSGRGPANRPGKTSIG